MNGQIKQQDKESLKRACTVTERRGSAEKLASSVGIKGPPLTGVESTRNATRKTINAETGELSKEALVAREPSGTALTRSRSLRQPTVVIRPDARRASAVTTTMVNASPGSKETDRARDASIISQTRHGIRVDTKRGEHIPTQSLGVEPSRPRTPQVGRQLASHNRTTSLVSAQAGATFPGSVVASRTTGPTKPPLQPFRKYSTSVTEPSSKSISLIRRSSTTNQQHFSPTKQPARHYVIGTSTPSGPPSPANVPTNTHPRSLIHLQTHLLHLHLLHSQASSTHTQWLQSAHTKLHTQFTHLLASHRSTLALERTTLEHRNLLALNQWSNGNLPSLSRKLNTLVSILTDLCALTAGDPPTPTWTSPAQEQGPYTHLITQFTRWVACVRSIWLARDRAAKDTDTDDDDDDHHQATDTDTVLLPAIAIAIDALGDGVKAEMRRLGDALAHISSRLEDLRAGEMADAGAGASCTRREDGENMEEEGSTPAALVDTAWRFTRGMVEELQLMREVEFEVVEGEKAWMGSRIKGIAGEVEAGFVGMRSVA